MQDHLTSKEAKHKVKSLTFNNNLVSRKHNCYSAFYSKFYNILLKKRFKM